MEAIAVVVVVVAARRVRPDAEVVVEAAERLDRFKYSPVGAALLVNTMGHNRWSLAKVNANRF